MKDMVTTAIDAAKEAGKFLLDNFGNIGSIEHKGDRNLATNLDKEAEKIIVDKIRKKFPGHGILAEEGGSKHADREYLWIIDPLDGTHNYIRNIPVFGVSIGIVHKHRFVAGAIYMPVEDELYAGEKNNGSYKNGKKIRVSSKAKLEDCSISFDSSIRYSSEVMLKALGELAHESFNIRMFGSSVRILSYVAEGKLDASVEFHDMPWDFAGSVAIIEEAGGKLSNLKGERLSYRSVGYIASNKLIHDKILRIIRRIPA
jgi:myo-inositol-1(or 4)-monophosphatase